MTDSVAAPTQIEYLETVAAMPAGRAYKRRLLELLDLRPGQTVVDVGCGPGADLASMSAAVTAAGAVLGIDHDPSMVERARLATAGLAGVDVMVGDAHALPLPDACADRARADRILQHVAEPAWALAELRRVVRPGGRAGLAEPDWDTLVVDDVDVATSRAFARFLAGRVRNPAIGRQLPRLATGAGFGAVTAEPSTVLLLDFGSAEQILGLRRNVARAVDAGILAAEVGGRWLDRLAGGPFLACFTLFTVVAMA